MKTTITEDKKGRITLIITLALNSHFNVPGYIAELKSIISKTRKFKVLSETQWNELATCISKYEGIEI